MEEVFYLFNRSIFDHFQIKSQSGDTLIDTLINSHFLKKGDKNGKRIDGFTVLAFTSKQKSDINNINLDQAQLVFIEDKHEDKYRKCFFDILEDSDNPRCIAVHATKTGQKLKNKKIYQMKKLVYIEDFQLTPVEN